MRLSLDVFGLRPTVKSSWERLCRRLLPLLFLDCKLPFLLLDEIGVAATFERKKSLPSGPTSERCFIKSSIDGTRPNNPVSDEILRIGGGLLSKRDGADL
jgi:hypothetical protein